MTTTLPPNTLLIQGQPALITYEPELRLFRGRFLGLTGYCDFMADSLKGLQEQGEISLAEYLADCEARSVAPFEREDKLKTFTLRYPASFSERLAVAAAEQNMSVNSFIVDTLARRMKLR
ncbi:type II toxin-antitoxin system HicB family antitoxin [Franconibacter pulveris 1160]|jgi:predicted HicB family RNase H-like nuclease|uniref:DNA repair protein n=2 Tax=Franconibacter TaxID=1649295 RepID=A0A0J8VRE6_9ENTR|nr:MULTISPECIES: type II toxin-antitoxin system HicB family antitoxin [Franconibacter]KMV35746.1 DNA repair protein [Franconibacter pulveris]MCK1968256.1 type II toxin-antitoxin system HicB family antitoxin [Franconibacter sp. IITDAS19]